MKNEWNDYIYRAKIVKKNKRLICQKQANREGWCNIQYEKKPETINEVIVCDAH